MGLNMNEGEREALKREKHELGTVVLPIIMFSLFLLIPVFVIKDDRSTGIALFVGLGLAVFYFVYYAVYRIFAVFRTAYVIKNGREIKCDFVSSKAKYRIVSSNGQKLYSIKVDFYNDRNERKVFTTRPLFNASEAFDLEKKRVFLAKSFGIFLVITEQLSKSVKVNSTQSDLSAADKNAQSINLGESFYAKNTDKSSVEIAKIRTEMDEKETAFEKSIVLLESSNSINRADFLSLAKEIEKQLIDDVKNEILIEDELYKKYKIIYDYQLDKLTDRFIALKDEVFDDYKMWNGGASAVSQAYEQVFLGLKKDFADLKSFFYERYDLLKFFQVLVTNEQFDELLHSNIEDFAHKDMSDKEKELYNYSVELQKALQGIKAAKDRDEVERICLDAKNKISDDDLYFYLKDIRANERNWEDLA